MEAKRTDCHTCINENCLIKKHCLGEDSASFLAKKHTVNCRKTQQIILEGAPVYGLYFIYNGSVKVFQSIMPGRDHIIRFSKNGEIIGHRGFGTGVTYNVSAEALDDSVLCHFGADDLKELMHRKPDFMYDFMLFYADQLQKSETNTKRFGLMTVREKVINAVLLINKRFGQTNGFINITLPRKDIAEFAGTTEEQVIKVLSALKKDNFLVTKGKLIGIPDLKILNAELAEHKMILES